MTSLTEQELLALEARCNALYDAVGRSLRQALRREPIGDTNMRRMMKAHKDFAAARDALPRVLKELRDARERENKLIEKWHKIGTELRSGDTNPAKCVRGDAFIACADELAREKEKPCPPR